MLSHTLSAILLGTIAVSTVSAADPDSSADFHLGFDFGFNFNLMNDDRFDGAGTTFALTFPVKGGLVAGVYHERGNLAGEEDGTQIDVDTTFYEIRVGYAIWKNAGQELSIFLGFGHADYTGDIDQGEFVGDVGIKFAPLAASSGPFKGQLDIHANYRYARIDGVTGVLTEEIDDLGGFQIGLGVGIYF